jgi:hypothetical protein
MRYLFSILFIGFFPYSLFCQTTITGANSNDWNDIRNWTNELSVAGNNSTISAGLTAYNDEIIENFGTIDNRENPDIALMDDKATLIAFGIGVTLGEFYGGVGELEVDFRTLALQLEVGGGINSDGNGCVYGGLVAGKRNFYEAATTQWTLFTGGFAGYMNEDDDYEYMLVGAKIMTGYTTFSANRAFWGIDIGLKVGYRMQFYDDEYGDNYSGFTGGIETRYRFGL